MAYDLGTAHGQIVLEYDGGRAVNQAESDIDKLQKKSKSADKDVSKFSATLGNLGKGIALTGLAVSIANVATQAAALGVQVLGIVPSLLSIGSLAAGLPAAFVGLAATAGVLTAVFSGVGEASKAAFDTEHPEKFKEALEKLSPSAQAFAKSVRAAAPELVKFQKGLQESFFSSAQLAAQMPRVMSRLQDLAPNLNGLSSQFGSLTRRVTGFALSGESVDFVNRSIASLRRALDLASPALGPILTGLRDVGEVGSQLMERLGASVGNVGTRFGEFLTQIASDDRLQYWIDTALDTLALLGDIIKNVGSILNSVFSTAQATGGGLLSTIADITGQFAAFLNSAEGSSALTSLFTSIMQVAGQLAPIITTLVGALAGALGPALGQIANEVGPALLQVVQAIAPALGPIATAIADVLSAVAPLLPPLAQLASLFAQQLAGGLSVLAAEIGPVAALFGGALLQAFQTLAPVITSLVTTALPLAAQLGAQLATAFGPLVPVIIQLAQTIVDSLLPHLPTLVQSFASLIPSVVQLATVLSGQLAAALLAIIPYIPQIVSAFVSFVSILPPIISGILTLVTFFAQLGSSFMNVVGIVVGAAGRFVSGIVNAFTTAASAVSSGVSSILSFFGSLPGRIGGAIAALPGVIVGVISRAVHLAAFSLGAGIGTLVSLAATAPGRIAAAISGLVSAIGSVVRNAWNSARNLFNSGVSAAQATARTLPGRVRGAIAALPGQIAGIARAAWAALRSAFASGISAAVSLAASLPGRIRGAVSGMGGALVSAGRDAVMGLVRGISGAIGAAVSAAASVGRSVISGIKSTLKISSPSRVMIAIGRFVTQGLVNGLLGTAKQVRAASTKLANIVNDAFSDKLIKRSQRNSVLAVLSRNTGKMAALANRTVTVAAKLKAAQKSLADVQKLYSDAYQKAYTQTQDSFQLVTSGQQFVNLDITKDRLQKTVAVAKQFAADLATLTKRGIHKDLLADLANAGAADAGAMARALATASAADLKQFNTLQSQLNNASEKVGKSTADALYGAGVKAAQGLVAGLKAQQAAIEKQMLAIALSMKNAIKKALSIRSPSRVMRGLGENSGQGLLDGLLAYRRRIASAAATLAKSSIAGAARIGMPTAVSGFSSTGSQVAPVAQNVTNFNQTVHALPGQSPRSVADYAMRRLALSLKTGVSAVSNLAPVPQEA